MVALTPGLQVWAHTGTETSFERGTIERHDAHKGTYDVKLPSGTVTVKEADVHKVNQPHQDGLPDNTYLRELNEATLLHNVRTRYNDPKDDGGCYSVTGHILIAVNPFRNLKIYEESNHKRYLSQPIGKEPPHIYATADRMYRLLVSSGDSQAIIVSGPSGSGKTETCKYVLRHLAYVSKDKAAAGAKSSQELGKLLVQTNPLLEAFGNAETTLNKNSSRFGKFVKVLVSRPGAILGATIDTYLLETTRVVMHAERECNYHINYQLVLGASRSERATYQLEADPNSYAYLRSSSGKATERRGEDPTNFKEVCGVLELLRVKPEMVQALFCVLSGLLALGSVTFGENQNGEATITGMDHLKKANSLLSTNVALLQQALCSRTMKLKGSEMQIPLKPPEARSSRDALSKAVYLKLFGWVVSQVNTALLDPKVNAQQEAFLGILDIYGFENFEKNSLEQLFINFTNEQLHQHFAISLFKTEQEIYAAEGIVWPGVDWEDNSDCIELIAGKAASSIFNSLSEHSRLPNSSDTAMTEALLSAHRKSKVIAAPKLTSGAGRTKGNRLTAKEAFVIEHFAGSVTYRTEGWLSKNTDSLHEDLSLCMSSSTSLLLAQLFQQGALVNAIGGGRAGGSRRAGFVAEKYARQLEILMLTLRSTHSHFVRCIKPNHEQVPRRFVNELVLQQLLNSGMVDAVRLLSAGYPTRVSFEQLEQQFKPLAPKRFQALPPALFSAALLRAFDLSNADFLLGLKRAFFKSGKLAFVDSLAERARNGTLDAGFWSKMGRLLTLWRFRRAISAVKCLGFLEAKMRRLRALWKFRRSANIANFVGRSWVRRANEIRYGRAIEVLQACGRGFAARQLRKRMSRGIVLVQKMGRGYLARIYRDRLRVEREEERKRKAKEERERKIRERKEAMERQEQQSKEERLRADNERREKMKLAAAKAGGGAGAQVALTEPGARADGQMNFKRKPMDVSDGGAGKAGGAVDEGELSEGSDLVAEDSDDEAAPNKEGDMQDPRALLAATAALDMRPSRTSSAEGGSRGSIPGLNLNRLGGGEDGGDDDDAGNISARRSSFSTKQSWISRKTGMSTPRSSFLSARGRSSSALGDGRKLLLSKTSKGSLVAAATLRVSKRAGEGASQERFALLVGDNLFIFMLQAQPDLPLALRLWPAQLICLNMSTLAASQGRAPEVAKDGSLILGSKMAQIASVGVQADDKALIARFGLAMSLGIASVRRARQQARLTLAQQLCHEKKLSLMKTQHMIDLLHKSQEMFFEAGSGQFDDCNAVCMHSGVMRQSLIDVTPFMPVSDFICEYCSCVIIPEEKANAANEAYEAKAEEHKQVVKKEQVKKLQLDDETLMLARDIRSLRERRKGLEEEMGKAYAESTETMRKRQLVEARRDRLDWSLRFGPLNRDEIERTRQSLVEQIALAKKAYEQAAAQLQARQEKLAKREAAVNEAEQKTEEEIKAVVNARSGLSRRLSFGRRRKSSTDGDANGGGGGGGSTLTRVLSFGRRGKAKPAAAADGDTATEDSSEASSTPRQRTSVAGNLVRKLSFGRKRQN